VSAASQSQSQVNKFFRTIDNMGSEVKCGSDSVLRAAVVLLLVSCLAPVSSTDLVYIRSKSFGQLVTSSTMRWVRGHVKDAVVLVKPDQVLCRISHAGKEFLLICEMFA